MADDKTYIYDDEYGAGDEVEVTIHGPFTAPPTLCLFDASGDEVRFDLRDEPDDLG